MNEPVTAPVTAPDLHVTARLPERGLDVDLHVPAGRTLALLGANGAGKSSVLETVAGLLTPYDGTVTVGDRTLTRVEGGRRRTYAPTHDRSVGLLAQEARLFPHLDAAANVAFGPRSRGVGRREARRLAATWLERVGCAPYADRRPHQLSGGQAQRVALARTLAVDPAVVLLDEPLAALDVDVTPRVRLLLREVLGGRTAVVATHDVLDALLLADEVAVLEAGRVVEQGPTRQVLTRPRSAFGARIAGLNLVAGRTEGATVLRTPDGTLVTGHLAGSDERPVAPEPGQAAVAVFRPSAVAIHPARTAGAETQASPRNSFAVTVAALEQYGDLVRVRGDLSGADDPVALYADVTPAAVADLALAPGRRVRFVVKAAEVAVHPA